MCQPTVDILNNVIIHITDTTVIFNLMSFDVTGFYEEFMNFVIK